MITRSMKRLLSPLLRAKKKKYEISKKGKKIGREKIEFNLSLAPHSAKSNGFVDEKVEERGHREHDWSFGGTFSGAWKVLSKLE